MNQVCDVFYKKQYIGHAQHEGPFVKNTYELYEYLIKELHYEIVEADIVFTLDGVPVLHHGIEAEVYRDGEKSIIEINKTTAAELKNYSLSIKYIAPFTLVEELFILAKKHHVCVMLDLTFQHYTFKHLRILYNIIRKNQMRSKTIWGDVNVFKLALIDPQMICQVGGSWGRKLLLESFIKSFFCKQIIMSFSYYGGEVKSFKKIVEWGHRLGFIMKVATVNDSIIAKKFWDIGTDLINTDTLLNS